jgi:hypothetical protein
MYTRYMSKKNILIIGKSPLVLENVSASLRELGYDVDTTSDFDQIASRFDLQQVDLITLGGQVPPEKKTEIKQASLAVKPDMLFVYGLAGIPGLIVQQIESEFTKDHQDPAHTPSYDPATRTIKLSLQEAADVTITGWWQTSFVPPNPGSASQTVIDERLPAGEHAIPLPSAIPSQASFATVKIGAAIYNFSLVTPGA